MIHRFSLPMIALSCVSLMVMTACDKESAEPSAVSGQVVAKVNDGEISIHQVNFELARNPQLRQVEPALASEVVVKQLVQQEVLVQKAKQAKMDRDPQVMQAIESSKRKILAQAYMQRAAAFATPPTQAEIDAFVQEHPEFFNKRRVYQLQEVAIDKNSVNEDELKIKLKANESFKVILEWLKTNNARVKASQGMKAAEQLPVAVARALLTVETQQVTLIPTEQALFLFHVVAAKEQPVPEDKVSKSAETYLLAQKRKKAAIDDAKAAYDNSKVEYLGQFAQLNQQASSSKDIETDIGIILDGGEKEAGTDTDASIESGLKGLK